MTKKVYFTIFISLLCSCGHMQAPVSQAPTASTAIIKFFCDAEAKLYIDGENKGVMQKDIPVRVSLNRGDYIVKVVSTGNEKDMLKYTYTVNETGVEKPEEIALKAIISKRESDEAGVKVGLQSIQHIEMITVGNYAIGKYEVTQTQWLAVMGSNPSGFAGCNNCPVEKVSWNDVQRFLAKLNSMTGKHYRLPTETEWEYAAKGGSQAHGYDYAGSNDIDAVAWYRGNSDNQTHPVGQKQPNELGIYDMTGNVWEWCSDWYDATQEQRVLRGGGWSNNPSNSQYAIRYYFTPGLCDYYIGFRLASSL